MIRIYSKTDIGRVRQDNQDAYFAETMSDNTAFAVVCDGMGGAAAGGYASKKAVELIKKYIQKSFRNDYGEKEITRLLQNAVLSANIELYRMSVNEEELHGMGTTVVACILKDDRAVICHVGDSRAYVIGQDVNLITRDHSVVQSLVESGKITEEEARKHPKKNIITRALGVEENVLSDIDCVDINKGDFILLCSDGLTNYLGKETIKEIFNKADNDTDYAETLVEEANRTGGGDNITTVVIKNGSKGE